MRRPWIPVLAAACWLLSVPSPASAEAVRVMAFGDSLTKGTGSTHGAGYRLAFYQKMREAGFEVDMLGTFHAGPKDIDRDHQGHQGQGVAKLDEVSFDELRRERPQMVILMIGTNDAKEGSFVPDAFRIRYSVLLDRILAESHTRLIAATIPPARYGKRDKVMGAVNAIIRSEVEKRAATGRVRLVDVNGMLDNRADYVDPLHLNDDAYARIGTAFADTAVQMLHAQPASAATR